MSNKTLRLGLVTGEFPPQAGGVGDFTCRLGRALAGLGAEVHVITRPGSRGFSDPDLLIHPCIGRWSFAALWTLRRLARRLRLDLLNVQYQAAAYDLSAPIHFLPRAAGVPVVVTFHDLRIPYLFPKAGGLRPAAVTFLARAAAGAIATDPADERELRRRGVSRVAQIPIGSNIRPQPPAGYDRAAWRARLGVEPQDLLLGYFGFLSESKGGDTLVSALGELGRQGVQARLLLIGGPGGTLAPADAAFAARIERQVAGSGLTGRVLRTGFVSEVEVSGHLLTCDVVALPYRDGVSTRRGSFMAALAHGCAVITTLPAASLPGLMDGENVRLVPPDDAPAIARAACQLQTDAELRLRLGAGARALSARFEWGPIARQTLDFFQACAAF